MMLHCRQSSQSTAVLLLFVLTMIVPAWAEVTTSKTADLGYLKDVAKDMQVRPITGKGGPTGSGIMYITDKIPPIEYPSFRGEFYTVTEPDTLDLAERCRLAVHGLTCNFDPAADYAISFFVAPRLDMTKDRPHGFHDYNGGQAKWIEDLPLLRTASGSAENLEIDKKTIELFFHMLGPDGLYYMPTRGVPYEIANYYADSETKQSFNSWPAGRALLTLCCWYSRAPGNAVYKNAIERMVDGLDKIAQRQDDYCYFRERKFDNRMPIDPMKTGHDASVTQSSLMTGLAQAYTYTHYEPARKLAEELARGIMFHMLMFTPEGRLANQPRVHFHGTTIAMMGILELGLATGDHKEIQFIKTAYEDAKTYGVPEAGWFPELAPAEHAGCETCPVADMTIVATKLSRAGVGDYWEDIEHYVRNQLQSNQVTSTAWLEHFASIDPTALSSREAWEKGPQRMIGTFTGMGMLGGDTQVSSSGCCTGNGPRALWFAWRHILTEKNDTLSLNLLLNRAHKSADVFSYLPYQGKVELMLKADKNLQVHIPSWVEDGEVKCTVNGKARECAMAGRYLQVGALKKDDKVTVEFPQPDRIVKGTVKWKGHIDRDDKKPIKEDSITYDMRTRGFHIVDLSPRESRLIRHNYTREDWRQDRPRMLEVTHFAPEDEMSW